MSETAFSGPVATFTHDLDGSSSGYSDKGWCVMSQVGTITQNSTTAVSYTFYLPQGSQIVDIIADEAVAYDSATSATLSVGKTAGGTEYASGVNAKTGGRVRPTFTATQVGNMANIGTSAAVVATITVVGATTVGTVYVTVLYVQKP